MFGFSRLVFRSPEPCAGALALMITTAEAPCCWEAPLPDKFQTPQTAATAPLVWMPKRCGMTLLYLGPQARLGVLGDVAAFLNPW